MSNNNNYDNSYKKANNNITSTQSKTIKSTNNNVTASFVITPIKITPLHEKGNTTPLLSPPPICKASICQPSKKRKVLSLIEFKNLKRKKVSKTPPKKNKSNRQQSITSFVTKSDKFISVNAQCLPLLNLREEYIDKLPKKNMLAQIGKCVKNNFTMKYIRKTNCRSSRLSLSSH
mmetsp:Transcript_13332/g.19065  ORF Transcript_13332/g.19065 Transcript_13332/m.19065 type:complete len:175 (-) Transcript_13332:487-1011(-)